MSAMQPSLPGRVCLVAGASRGLGRGIARVDWGMGDSGYKETLGAVPGPALCDFLLLRPGLPAALAAPIRRVWRGR